MKSTSKATPSLREIEEAIRKIALRYPETREDFPWGHSAFKVKEKAFVFMGGEKDEVSFSVKLPQSRDIAVDLPFTEPTGYGLGKAGWVTVTVRKDTKITLDLIKAWIDESFRAVAPKKLIEAADAIDRPAARKRG
jgi:predicted DNA-binding protein (MmcQ/YjbR family)